MTNAVNSIFPRLELFPFASERIPALHDDGKSFDEETRKLKFSIQFCTTQQIQRFEQASTSTSSSIQTQYVSFKKNAGSKSFIATLSDFYNFCFTNEYRSIRSVMNFSSNTGEICHVVIFRHVYEETRQKKYQLKKQIIAAATFYVSKKAKITHLLYLAVDHENKTGGHILKSVNEQEKNDWPLQHRGI